MELESFILAKLPFEVEKNDAVTIHVISSKIYVLRITSSKHISLYSFDETITKENFFQLIWRNEKLSDCAVVSNDGYLFVKYLDDTFCMYSIKECNVEEVWQLLLYQFKELLDTVEFGACDLKVTPVTFTQGVLIICLNKQWLLTIDGLSSKPNVIACLKIESIVSSCIANKEFVFSMTVEGALFVHKITDGKFVQKIDMWNWLPWRESYRLLDITEEPNSLLALLDPSNTVYLFDLSSALSGMNNIKFDDSQSISSASSGVSYKTKSSFSSISRTSSVAGSVISRQLGMRYKAADDLWFSYLEKLKKTQSKAEKRLSSSTMKLERGPEDMVVHKVTFTDVGLSVMYASRNSQSGGLYRLFNTENGQQGFSTIIPKGYHVLPLRAPSVTLDIFVLKNSLCLPLFEAPKHSFINKMLQCIDSRCIRMLLEGWEELLHPPALLQSALTEGQLDKVHLVLNLHSHLFKLEIVGDGLEGIYTKDILDKLMEVTNSSTATDQFIRQVRGLQLTHSYRLLGILDEVNIPTNLQSEVAVIRNQIMGSIVAARAGLENGVEGLAPVPPEHSVEWVLWEGMSDMDVVRVGVARLSAVQCFLAVQRGWTPEELSGPKFKEVVLGSALHLLEKRDVDGASHLISVTGFNAEEELRKICLNSLNKNLVDFMIESLIDLWMGNELQAWEFLNLITTVVQRCKYLVHEKNVEEILQLSLTGIMSITDDKKQDIITELYFRTWDESLLLKLKKEDCWRHLIENNCVEGLQVWLDLKQPPCQFSWPINLFCQWNITQEMIDSINNFVCTECTKEIIFNYLSLKGLFCTESKKNPQKVLKRLAGTKSLLDIENIINSNLSDNFLSFICDYNLTDFAVILHKEIPSLLSLSSFRHQRHTTKWMDLWQSFIDVEGVWDDNSILEVIQRTTDFVSNGSQDSYNRDHPLVSVAVALNQNKSLLEICNDPLTISPLLAISMPLDKTDDRRETTLYSLLSGTTAFHTDTLFQWHNDSSKSLPKGVEPIFPHFSNEKLSIQYGHKQCLTYLDHLKQGRPCFAFVQFFHEISNVQGCIPTRMQKRGTNIAHGLALEYFKDKDIGCSCVVFTELLSRDSTPLRIHLACIDAIFNAEFECGTNDLRNILHGIVMNKQEPAENLMKILEEALHPQLQELCGHNKIACLRLWQLPVLLANLHQLSLPESLLLHGAENNNWLLFVTVICLFNYPKWQVMQLIKKFSSDAFQEHFTYALQLKVDNQGHYNTSVSSSRLTQSFITSEKLFPCVAEHGNIPERLLLQARAQRCSGFALLATCFQSRNLIACFSEWLAAGLPTGYESILPSNPMDWSSSHVSHLLEIVVGLSYINSLHHVLSVFFPTNPLHIFSKFLLNTVEDKKFVESSFNLELFKESLSSLSENEQDFLFSKTWVSKTIVKLCSVALIKCFPAYSQQHLFLLTICNSALVTHLPVTVEGPDFLLLLNLTECLSEDGLTLDYALICEEDYEHFSFDKQLLKLINSHKFSVAHQFATIARLQHNKIFIVEWKEKAKVKSDTVCIRKFWESCDAAFIEGSLPPDDAVLFYTEQADLSNSTQGRCITLKYALKWIGLKPSNDTTKYQELSVLYSLYLSFLQDDFNIESTFSYYTLVNRNLAVEDLCFKPLKCFRKDVVSPATLDWFKQKSVTSLKTSEMDRLDALLKKLLAFGDLSTVWCLEALFKYKIKDSLILDGCLGLAEGQFSVDDMPENIAQILSEGISSLRASISSEPFASSTLNLSHSFSSSYSFGEDFEEINTEENQETEGKLKVINSLVDSATCCTRLVQYIQSALRIAKKFNMQYKDVIEMENPLVLIEKSCDSLHVAKDVIILANLPADQTVFYLCSQIVKAVNSSEKWFSGYGELTDLLSLAEDPLRLGKLLTAAASLTQPESFNQTAELLILAHSCFTRACNMEGISKVLKMCQKLTEVLHENFQWSLMVRLLTGIGRYTEMRYIFHLLKVNQQFECLLSKGLDKYSGLKSATLEFVRGDKELFTLVALHFRMYSELAAMFEEIASTYLDGLEFVDDGKILHNDHNVQNLQAAIKAYTHTAQHYIQGKKLKRATNVVNQAELATLQLSFLCTVEKGQLAVSLLRLQLPQVTSLITNTLNYEEACIVAQAYNVSVEWSSALYQQFIVKGNQQYLTAWSRHHDLNYTTVQDIVRRFQQEKTLSDSMVKNMKQFIHVIKYTDLKYRVSSQIGFKDVLQTLLSGPELPYLKDTVWQSGFKKQHL